MGYIEVKDEHGDTYRFKKKHFDVELLKVVDDGKSIKIVGYAIDFYEKSVFAGFWDMGGNFYSGRANYKDYNLTPVVEPKQSELEAMKEKYATGDYVWYVNFEDKWILETNEARLFHSEAQYKRQPIHNRHAHIAEAVAKDSSVEVEYLESVDDGKEYWFDIDFFTDYNDQHLEYRLKQPTKDLTGYRIKVTPETQPEIERLIRKEGYEISTLDIYGHLMPDYLIYNKFRNYFVYGNNLHQCFKHTKPMYLHNHELVLQKPKEGILNQDEIDNLLGVEEDVCEWTFDGFSTMKTSCGWNTSVDRSGFQFCPFCSKRIVATAEKG